MSAALSDWARSLLTAEGGLMIVLVILSLVIRQPIARRFCYHLLLGVTLWCLGHWLLELPGLLFQLGKAVLESKGQETLTGIQRGLNWVQEKAFGAPHEHIPWPTGVDPVKMLITDHLRLFVIGAAIGWIGSFREWYLEQPERRRDYLRDGPIK